MNKSFPKRKPQRLPGYDYSLPGAYFVTICTQNRMHLFGCIEDGTVHLNDAGRMVWQIWNEIILKFPTVRLDEFVVMPNHVHAVLWLTIPDSYKGGASRRAGAFDGHEPSEGPGVPSLPDVMQWFKSLTTARYRQGVKNANWTAFPGSLWQRSYYDHIVRCDEALNRIRQYIRDNPKRWSMDRYNPEPIGPDPMAAEIWRMLQNP